MQRHLTFTLLALLFVATTSTCREDSAAPKPKPQALISDGGHSAGNPHFFFLPPLVPGSTYPGTFDPTYSPTVSICEWNGTTCTATLATFTTTTEPGSETIRVDIANELYVVNWDTKQFQLDPARTYRITVAVGRVELGIADVDVVISGQELRSVETGQYIGLVGGRVLPVKFRIERGVLCASNSDCAEATIGTEGGTLIAASGLAGVTVPSAALSGTIHLSLGRRESAPCLPGSNAQIGPCYEILTDQQAGFTLSTPATVGICALQAEPGIVGQLAKVDPQDPNRTVVLLDPASPTFLDCTAASYAALSVGGLTRSFSYVAPTIQPPSPDATTSVVSTIPRSDAAVTGIRFTGLRRYPGDQRDAADMIVTGGLVCCPLAVVGATELVRVLSSTGLPVVVMTGSLVTPRYGHTSTLLADGRVLVTGGVGGDFSALSSAEIYAPNLGAFKAAGNMSVARAGHTATLLNNGKVLISGGWSTVAGPALASAELFDPVTETFVPTGSMNSSRLHHAATLLADNRVLITGGMTIEFDAAHPQGLAVALASMETYDLVSGAFAAAGNMARARYYHTANYLPPARYNASVVFVAGGTDGSVVHYFPEFVTVGYNVGAVSRLAFHPLAVAVHSHAATVTEADNVLISGGATDVNASAVSSIVQWYCASCGYEVTYNRLPSLTVPRAWAAGQHIWGNRFLVIGGVNGPLATNPTYPSNSEVWSFAP